MELRPGKDLETTLRDVVGYLNFSAGAPDARFQRNLNTLYRWLTQSQRAEKPWLALGNLLQNQLSVLAAQSEAFADIEQARAATSLVFDQLLKAYREHHRDLLFHQTDDLLFGPFFLARVCEAVLQEGSPWDEGDRIVRGALRKLNDFIGHRPVAVVRSAQKIEPYEHEWVRPLPLYLRGVGTVAGPYEELLNKALAILTVTDAELLDQACFDLDLLDELALDPRAYDFEHPVNKRPNYHFGQWDPHQIDNQGRYRRFVLQQVTLDAMLDRVAHPGQLSRDEAAYEAAAVLAGTILMAAGTSGRGPETHDSATTLGNLLPRIARYRDVFYQQLPAAATLTAAHAERLRKEAATLKQPFGGARQHLNQRLARLRGKQLQHVHLAQLYSRMGFAEAASRQARVVPVASTRMLCDLDCWLTAGHHAIDRGMLSEAAECLPKVEDLLHRGIGCGAIVDPWNILGFAAHFSLFPAVENSVRDHRVDQVIRLMQQIFGLCARLQGEAAAAGETALGEQVALRLKKLAAWWDKFATLDVSGVESVSGRETYDSARQVSAALGAWHRAGAAAANIGFWRPLVSEFSSPKAFALVVEALLDKRDHVAAMALLMQWLSQVDQVPLEDGDYSFGKSALRWLRQVLDVEPTSGWPLVQRFFDHLEANADEYWQAPRLQTADGLPTAGSRRDEEDGDGEEDLFGAAYESVTFRDSAADGFEGEMLESGGQATDYELDLEQARLGKRLMFLSVVAHLWKLAARHALADSSLQFSDVQANERTAMLAGWLLSAQDHHRGLTELLNAVHRHQIPTPRNTQESLLEYDRRRLVQESLLERIVAAQIAVAEASQAIVQVLATDQKPPATDDWEPLAALLMRAMFRGQADGVRSLFPPLLAALGQQPLLYIPLSRGGDPSKIVAARVLHQTLRELLEGLPRLGLLREAGQLIEVAQAMERDHPVGSGAVTEFDRLFEIGQRAIVEALVSASDRWENGGPHRATAAEAARSDSELIDCLQTATELLLKRWLAHSRNLRLSVLEKIGNDQDWQRLKEFIEKYGRDLFTQTFLNIGNLRAILHQGASTYLEGLIAEGDNDERFALLDALDDQIPLADAAAHLELALEAVVDNYGEYLDYNTTTTQSDRGEMLYVLLDLLRLKGSYERTAWNIRPAVTVHEVLVRNNRMAAAEQWRRMLLERTSPVADRLHKRLEELCRNYGVRLATVADRFAERFVQPLTIDRLRALIHPAISELRSGPSSGSFELLEQEIDEFCRTPIGVGIDVPAWLSALEQEVEQAETGLDADDLARFLPPERLLSLDEVYEQLTSWDEAS